MMQIMRATVVLLGSIGILNKFLKNGTWLLGHTSWRCGEVTQIQCRAQVSRGTIEVK